MCDTPCLEKVFSRINAKFDQFNTLKSTQTWKKISNELCQSTENRLRNSLGIENILDRIDKFEPTYKRKNIFKKVF